MAVLWVVDSSAYESCRGQENRGSDYKPDHMGSWTALLKRNSYSEKSVEILRLIRLVLDHR